MDLQTRKYQVINELVKVESEQMIELFEDILNMKNRPKHTLPAWQKAVIDERLQDLKANPEKVLNWDNLKEVW